MVTTVVPNVLVSKTRPGRRYDNLFVSGMVSLLLGTVLFGFARTYFLVGMFRAPLANRLLHVHGAVFTCWMLLLIVQTSLIRGHRVDVHRKLGLVGFGRNVAPIPHLDAKTFYTIPMGGMLIFSTLIFFAYRMRRNPAAHKRLILIATIAIMDAAIDRWPLAFVHHNHVSELFNYSFLLFIVVYDLWSTGKVQQVTAWASLFVIAFQQLRIPIGQTSTWQGFATWVQSLHI
jgi:hypothetical protein